MLSISTTQRLVQALARIGIQGLLGIISLAICVGILVAGLWPFNFRPENKVSWLKEMNGVRIERYGIIYGTSLINTSRTSRTDGSVPVDSTTSIQLVLTPGLKTPGKMSVVLFLTNPDTTRPFVLAQWKSELVLRAWFRNRDNHVIYRELGIPDPLHKGEVEQLTITSGQTGINVYLSGALKGSYPEYKLVSDNFSGQLVLGNSSTGHGPWIGTIHSLAISDKPLTTARIAQQFKHWRENRTPGLSTDEGVAGLYLFDERSGNQVRNHVGRMPDLFIPGRFEALEKTILTPPWDDYPLNLSHVMDIVLNIVAFVPFGLVTSLYLNHTNRLSRFQISVIAIIFASTLSLIIELLQVYLPSRSSSLSDLLCNTIGSILGVLSFIITAKSSQT